MVLIAIALMMAVPPERWVRVGGDPGRSQEFLDTESIRRSGDKVTLWTRRDFAPGQGTAWNEVEIDCRLRTEAVLAHVRDDGRAISHNEVRPHRAAAPIARNSTEERIREIACR